MSVVLNRWAPSESIQAGKRANIPDSLIELMVQAGLNNAFQQKGIARDN